MEVALLPYKQHFEEYGCNFYTIRDEIPNRLSQEERYLLSAVGLPDAGLPFFHFDLCLQLLRDIDLPDSLIVLGTGIEAASYNYIYVGLDHKVYVQLDDGRTLFINSSVRQLIQSIFAYSTWLEELEDMFFEQGSNLVDGSEIFELYYQLRTIDPDGVVEDSIWNELINTEISFDYLSEDSEECE